MGAYVQILYQLIFRTKSSRPVMVKTGRQALYEYMHGILANKKCFCYQMGGVEDHVHLVFSLHPAISLSSLVQDLKVASSKMIKEKGIFPDFDCWAVGYSAFTYSVEAKDNLIRYVLNQERHHGKVSYEEETRELLKENGVEIDERYFLKE